MWQHVAVSRKQIRRQTRTTNPIFSEGRFTPHQPGEVTQSKGRRYERIFLEKLTTKEQYVHSSVATGLHQLNLTQKVPNSLMHKHTSSEVPCLPVWSLTSQQFPTTLQASYRWRCSAPGACKLVPCPPAPAPKLCASRQRWAVHASFFFWQTPFPQKNKNNFEHGSHGLAQMKAYFNFEGTKKSPGQSFL